MNSISFIHVLGEQVPAFLHHYCTVDVVGWDQQVPLEAMFLDMKGRLMALVTLVGIPGGVGIVCWGHPTADLVAHLERYNLRDDKVIRQAQVQFRYETLQSTTGWQSRAPMIRKVEVRDVNDLTLETTGGGNLHISPRSEDFTEIIGWDMLQDARIRAGFPFTSYDTVEATLPGELKRDDWDISYTKGCYLGQETVARLEARGHVNWVLVRLECEPLENGKSLPEGYPLMGQLQSEAADVGQVTSRSGAYALGRVRSLQAKPGTELIWSIDGTSIAMCRIVAD